VLREEGNCIHAVWRIQSGRKTSRYVLQNTEELPDFEDYSMENRTYKYMKNPALYPSDMA
jgi:hypothetical protein